MAYLEWSTDGTFKLFFASVECFGRKVSGFVQEEHIWAYILESLANRQGQ